MQNRRQYSSNTSHEIREYDTIESIFGKERKYENVRDDSRFIEFGNKLREIQNYCKNRYVDLGEAVVLINKTFGYIWDTIPFGKIDEILEWFQNNWFRGYAIMDSEKHVLIMSMNDPIAKLYQTFYSSNGSSRGPMGKINPPKIEPHWTEKF
jgi:hypothetical protein